jgi:hypothetical protein
MAVVRGLKRCTVSVHTQLKSKSPQCRQGNRRTPQTMTAGSRAWCGGDAVPLDLQVPHRRHPCSCEASPSYLEGNTVPRLDN